MYYAMLWSLVTLIKYSLLSPSPSLWSFVFFQTPPICSLFSSTPPHPYCGTSKIIHTLDSQGCGQLTASRLSTPPSIPSRTGVHSGFN